MVSIVHDRFSHGVFDLDRLSERVSLCEHGRIIFCTSTIASWNESMSSGARLNSSVNWCPVTTMCHLLWLAILNAPPRY